MHASFDKVGGHGKVPVATAAAPAHGNNIPEVADAPILQTFFPAFSEHGFPLSESMWDMGIEANAPHILEMQPASPKLEIARRVG